MISWSVELSEFDLTFEPRRPIKAQCLDDFISELQGPTKNTPGKELGWWTLYVDGVLNEKGY